MEVVDSFEIEYVSLDEELIKEDSSLVEASALKLVDDSSLNEDGKALLSEDGLDKPQELIVNAAIIRVNVIRFFFIVLSQNIDILC